MPPLRFWSWNEYARANSGCSATVPSPRLLNASIDLGESVADGHWVVLEASWSDPLVDGCPGEPHVTVAEVSDADAAREGTTAHGAFYLVAASADGDLDRVQGASGCSAADVAAAPVAGVELADVQRVGCQLLSPCQPDRYFAYPLPMFNGFRVRVRLEDPFPAWYTDTGRNGSPPLIAGYQIVYAHGASAADEPRTSDYRRGAWRPVRDPADVTRALGVVPVGIAEADVAFAETTGWVWVAARLVYADGVMNPVGRFDPGTELGPLVTTPVSHHSPGVQLLGWVDGSDVCVAADDHAPRATPVSPGTPLTLDYDIRGGAGAVGPVAIDFVLPDCIDATGFDPVANPAQVAVTPSGTLSWDPATRHLQVRLTPEWVTSGTITLTGLAAGALPATSCPFGASPSDVWGLSFPAFDAEGRCGTPVFDIATPAPVPVPPLPVERLFAAAEGTRVRLEWTPGPDSTTERYNLWAVDGDASWIPLAGKETARVYPATVRRACLDVPRAAAVCREPAAWGSLTFYQVRGVCSDASEGPL